MRCIMALGINYVIVGKVAPEGNQIEIILGKICGVDCEAW